MKPRLWITAQIFRSYERQCVWGEVAASLVRVVVEGPAGLPGGGGAPAQSLPSTCKQNIIIWQIFSYLRFYDRDKKEQ